MLVNHKRLARIMREDDLLALQPKRFVPSIVLRRRTVCGAQRLVSAAWKRLIITYDTRATLQRQMAAKRCNDATGHDNGCA